MSRWCRTNAIPSTFMTILISFTIFVLAPGADVRVLGGLVYQLRSLSTLNDSPFVWSSKESERTVLASWCTWLHGPLYDLHNGARLEFNVLSAPPTFGFWTFSISVVGCRLWAIVPDCLSSSEVICELVQCWTFFYIPRPHLAEVTPLFRAVETRWGQIASC